MPLVFPRKSEFALQLLTELQGRRTALPVDLEQHGVILARCFDYAGPYSISVTFDHPNGDIVIGSNWPSRAAFAGLTPGRLLESSYAELAEIVSGEKGCEWTQLDDSPWLTPDDVEIADCFDVDGSFFQETPALRSRLIQWLEQEDDEAPYIDGLFPELHEGLVGYAIRDGLPAAEAKRLKLVTGDFSGGPGGYAERVAYTGDPAILEAAFRKWNLPFTLGET